MDYKNTEIDDFVNHFINNEYKLQSLLDKYSNILNVKINKFENEPEISREDSHEAGKYVCGVDILRSIIKFINIYKITN